MAKRLQLGSRQGFMLELYPSKQIDTSGLVWANGRLQIAELPVIAGQDHSPVDWTWVDLLEWLAKSWPYLLLEQSFPFQVPATEISTLLGDLEKRWENLSEERVEDEEQQAHRFLARHDLASAFKGIFFPATYLMRQGAAMEIASAEHGKTIRLPLQSVQKDLEQIGNHLAKLALAGGKGRGAEAVKHWRAREQQISEMALPLHTSLSAENLAQINPGNEPDYWEYSPGNPLEESELMAAARMTSGVLLAEQQAHILSLVRNLSKSATPTLDGLASDLMKDFREIGKPYDQGYWAADWLRRRLGYNASAAVHPAELLRNWGVQIQDFEMHGSRLDALACWGPRHGPAILVNKAPESVPAHIHGENTTFAHEICHLLLDREGALPMAEVLNGNTPERLEKRARAFAVEFLLPRRVAATKVRQAPSLEQAVNELSETYKVSAELVSWQVINSEVYTGMKETEKQWLESQKR